MSSFKMIGCGLATRALGSAYPYALLHALVLVQ
jgi:hypothetical protein